MKVRPAWRSPSRPQPRSYIPRPPRPETRELHRSHKGATLLCRDCDGHEVELKKNPKRVVICYTSFIELWYLAGGEAVAMVDTANRSSSPKGQGAAEHRQFVNPNRRSFSPASRISSFFCGKIEKHRAVRGL
jgi:iron complex transport system substrate-binding protein